jgi:hypothetical protein
MFRVAPFMTLKRSAIRWLLTFGAFLSMSILCSPPLLAQDEGGEPTVNPVSDIAACTDENVKRAYYETNAFYKRVSKAGASKRFYQEVNLLWKRLPDCASPDNRGDLSHSGFQLYMDVTIREAYESMLLEMKAKKTHDAAYYITCYYRVQRAAHDEAVEEEWKSWLAFEAQSLPRVNALRKHLCLTSPNDCP